MTAQDRLRPPPTLDPRAGAYKDWLHVNLFDFERERVALFNTSLHGDPADDRSLAVGAVVVADLAGDLAAEVVVVDLRDAVVSPTSVAIGDLLAVRLDGDVIDVAARMPRSEDRAEVRLIPTSPPVSAEAPVPFGSGWIAWRASPRCAVTGRWSASGASVPVGGVLGYHDHNWGRWHWGDDAGWEWAALLAADGTAFVLTRTTDREHATGSPVLHAIVGGLPGRFPAGTVSIQRRGRHARRVVRLPGAMAALHGGRLGPALPGLMSVVADDAIDRLEIDIRPAQVCQLVTADPIVPGYGFIHEHLGRFTYTGRVRGEPVAGSGLAVFEHVD